MKKRIYNHSIDKDPVALKQFEDCYKEPFVLAAALMPDAHQGYAAPIGSVLVTKSNIVPAWVGFDIGCGMIAVKLSATNLAEKIQKNKKKIYSGVLRAVPMGLGHIHKKSNKVSKEILEKFNSILEKFQSKEYDKNILNYLKSVAPKHLGTLGSGNHFIELGFNEKNKEEIWLIIHTGSRGIGHTVAKKYMIHASESKTDYEKTFPLEDSSDLGKEYLNILDFGLEYALLNRLEIANSVIKEIEYHTKTKIKSTLWVNKNHNHAIPERGSYIHRKGATPAKKGERGVIPGNMRDGSYLVQGKGNPKFLHSSSHGAGRALSRTEAKQKITMSDFKKDMKNITSNVSQKTLDEAPDAYKNLDAVMKAQSASVKILKHILPLINWKG